MSEGLDAFEHIKNELKFFYHDDWEITRYPKDAVIVEKELEEAEENKKMLDIFKNALTVEHNPFSIEMQKENKDFVSLLCKNIATIRENELDKNLREVLKKWVLKNAFPKELKALEIIKDKRVNCFDVIDSVDYKHYLVLMEEYHKSWRLTKKEYDLLKEVLGDE